ncbi:hypothetical protein C7H19_24720 [Aphanothece hegewaldii CCALA 016]|uniref:Uncharacterized protein n=1 Tax=Aphanothece hegewaldii CCALA 016 TaxID=2107694 RepID=A0A2T1LQI6_9CHRO|nr:hypothetical protein [Aphanothece hegewaldii]PSF28338.1 hypothetical protein C7H19_24720 [Aphanothece hegewaldii CCALA 016]
MTLYLTHFDTLLRQDLQVTEPIKNCLAEYLFPDTRFAIGEINPKQVKAKELREYQGMTLQFASRERMYFSNRSVRDLLYPNSSDGAAYGSLPFTPCQSFSEIQQARVLVINDHTGDSNGILPKEQALKLVGDCHGKMSLELAEQLTGRKNAPFQFRLGIRPQENCQFYRIAKGTLAPDPRLETLTSDVIERGDQFKIGYDLILPTSSFKGRKGADAIQPGEYTLDLGIGIKTIAEYGKQSLGAQVLVNYPKGVSSEILPILQQKAEELAQAQSDLHALARHFVTTYEERANCFEEIFEELGSLTPLDALATDTEETPQSQEKLLFDLLKTDLEHHGQLLEHPFIIDELQKFLQRQWLDLATGRAIKFQAALAQPSLDLKENEVCVPKIPDGTELIVTRSPLVNSNGVIVLTNRHLPQLMKLEGSIHIHPDTAAKHLQADFDGDRLAFERADRYPTLTAEIKESLLPQNRYPDVIKRDKIPYSGSFEEIAVSAVKNDIGKIANQIMAAVTLRWETVLMPDEKQESYVRQVAQYYRTVLAKDVDPKKPFQIPEQYQQQVQTLANLPQEISPQQVEMALQLIRDIQFKIVGDLSNELQVAVDGPKSALRPDNTVLNACKEIGGYQPVTWLAARDKSRNPQVYRNKILDSSNYGPIDQMIRMTNEKWQQSCLMARPAVQFRGFFPEVGNPKIVEIAQEIKETYNDYLRAARSLEDLKSQHPELIDPYIEIHSTKSQKIIYLTRLERFGALNSGLLNKDTASSIDLRLVSNTFDREIPHSLLAMATFNVDGKTLERPIGAVTFSSMEEYSLKAGMKLTQAGVEIHPRITPERINGIYRSLDEYVEMLHQEHPERERQTLAAALWHNAHTRDDYQTKKALLAFKLFPNEVIEQLEKLQFTELKVVGLHFPTNEYGNQQWKGEEIDCMIAIHPIPDKTGKLEDKCVIKVEGQVLAPLTAESPTLAVGTQFKAAIVADPSTGVIATTPKGNTLKIGQIKNFAYREREWQKEEGKLTVTLVKNGRGKEMPLVTVDGNAMGVLDRESEMKLRERSLLNNKGFTFSARLENSPPTTAQIHVQPETVIYPWQQKEQEKQLEAKRTVYREKYEAYTSDILKNSARVCASRQEVDIEVAIRAYADTQDLHEVATILSQSDTVREWRAVIPHSRSWDEYLNQAKNYVRVIQAEAFTKLEKHQELG